MPAARLQVYFERLKSRFLEVEGMAAAKSELDLIMDEAARMDATTKVHTQIW